MCKCGRNHENKFIRGYLNYSEGREVVFCCTLLEHQNNRHIWLSLITGEWPGTGKEDCAVTAHIFMRDEERHFLISDGEAGPFEPDDIFDAYQVKREEVLAVNGAKEWFIETYLKLFSLEKEMDGYFQISE